MVDDYIPDNKDTYKALFNLQSMFVIHAKLLLHLPMYLAAPFILELSEINIISDAVNKINDCNLSSVHQLGMETLLSEKDQSANNNSTNSNTRHTSNFDDRSFHIYGEEFATHNGNPNPNTNELFNQIAIVKSSIWAARATKAVAHFELSETLLGNTIMAFINGTIRCNKREEQSFLFELLFFFYFFPLYIVLALYYTLLRLVPVCFCHSFFYRIHFWIIAMIQITYSFPICLLGILFILCLDPNTTSRPTKSKNGYHTIPGGNGIGNGEGSVAGIQVPQYTKIEFLKPRYDQKVGLRFGSDSSNNLMISNIKPNGLASKSGLRIGDIIRTLNGGDASDMSPREAATMLLEFSGVVRMDIEHSENAIEYDENTI
jgi:hypothetical protein